MKTCTLCLLFLFVLFISFQARSQVKIGDNAKSINPNSLLELESSTKGLLLPRLTNDQIKAMANVPTGMLLFSITDSALYVRRDTGWAVLGLKTGSTDSSWTRSGGNIVTANGTTKVGIGTTTPYSQLSNTPDNIYDKEGYGGNTESSLAWRSSGFGYVGMFTNVGGSRGLLVRTAVQGNGNAFEVDAADSSLLNVLSTGNVGIGTATPAAKLDVKGDIHYSGTLDMGIVDSVVNYNAPGFNSLSSVTVGCPTGYKLIGGGGGHRYLNDDAKNVIINYSGPDPDNLNRWKVLLTNNRPANEPRAIQVYSICAKVK